MEDDVGGLRVLEGLLGVERTVIEDRAVVHAWVWARERYRCAHCGRRRSRCDQGRGRRLWRALDVDSTPVLIEAVIERIRCSQHGVVIARFPWARRDSGFTRAFEDRQAWLALMRQPEYGRSVDAGCVADGASHSDAHRGGRERQRGPAGERAPPP